MSDESAWIERAQSAEARIKTLEDQYRPAIERVQAFKTNFGVRERGDGAIEIDYDKLVEGLGIEGWLELRAIGDARYSVSGEAGEKPKVKVPAAHREEAA